MGTLKIDLDGSFRTQSKEFGAITHGHAHAVAEAIEWLSGVVLPDAINQDHLLRNEDAKPQKGFLRPYDDFKREARADSLQEGTP